MSKWKMWSLIAVAALVVAGLSAGQQAPMSKGNLTGMVKSDAGKPMEGVAVSARSVDKTFTTTVYTDEKGAYTFPALEDGQYKLWAQAVGFDAAHGEQTLSKGKQVQQNFSLKTLEDFSKQLAGDELINSLPGNTPEDIRMKTIVAADCTGCHQSNFTLQNRFDEKGWTAILNYMEKTDGFGAIRASNPERVDPIINTYKKELVSYLTRVRGPSSTLDYKLVPRPTGDAQRVVITEYDLSPGSRPGYISPNNGTIWTDGTPSAHDTARPAHDIAVDKRGNVWFADQLSYDRTIGRLDPETGKVSGWKLAGANGVSVGTHGIIVDADGNVWFTNAGEGTFTKFDPKSEQFTRFPKPENMARVGGMLEQDSKGNIWAVSSAGAIKLDPKTGKYIDMTAVTKGGALYGFALDAKDNGWFTHLAINKIGIADNSGEVTEIALKPREDIQLSDVDRDIISRGLGSGNSVAPDQKGPRRLGGDKNGTSMYVAEFYSDSLAKIDINTRAIKEYKLPNPYVRPYSAVVDKTHMVWVPLMNTDRVARFDPNTEKFTEYVLPTRGTETRAITVDNNTNPPTAWVPYYRSGKLARIQVLPPAKGGAMASK